MPHFLNFDSMRESAFLLQHVCLASRHYCEMYGVNRDILRPAVRDWDCYAGMLKSFVSEVLIQNSTRSRIIQDTLKKFRHVEQDDFDISAISSEAIKDVLVAHFTGETKALSLREISNKVLHATDSKLVWAELEDGRCNYWTGRVMLYGRHDKSDWEVDLNAERYAHALVAWLDILDATVDWRLVYENDE